MDIDGVPGLLEVERLIRACGAVGEADGVGTWGLGSFVFFFFHDFIQGLGIVLHDLRVPSASALHAHGEDFSGHGVVGGADGV